MCVFYLFQIEFHSDGCVAWNGGTDAGTQAGTLAVAQAAGSRQARRQQSRHAGTPAHGHTDTGSSTGSTTRNDARQTSSLYSEELGKCDLLHTRYSFNSILYDYYNGRSDSKLIN